MKLRTRPPTRSKKAIFSRINFFHAFGSFAIRLPLGLITHLNEQSAVNYYYYFHFSYSLNWFYYCSVLETRINLDEHIYFTIVINNLFKHQITFTWIKKTKWKITRWHNERWHRNNAQRTSIQFPFFFVFFRFYSQFYWNYIGIHKQRQR